MQPIPHNPVSGSGVALLTPEVFLALDMRARAICGMPIAVRTQQEMGRDWGRVNMMAQDVIIDLAKLRDRRAGQRCYDEIGLIEVSPRVPVAQMHAVHRPELDWSKVPADRMFEFIVMHEVGHTQNNFEPVERAFSKSFPHNDREWGLAYLAVAEAIADRYAWSALFPGEPLPADPQRVVSGDYLNEWMERLPEHLRRTTRSRSREQDPGKWVPTKHVSKGIPWAPEVARDLRTNTPGWLARLNQARIDERNMQRRNDRRWARELSQAWAEYARRPTKSGKKFLMRGDVWGWKYSVASEAEREEMHARLIA
ncbi:hypothetical protein [Rhodanobacter lycopersici]